MSAPTHALSRKVLSLTKPKDKIYKTKNDNIKKIHPQLYNNIILVSFDKILTPHQLEEQNERIVWALKNEVRIFLAREVSLKWVRLLEVSQDERLLPKCVWFGFFSGKSTLVGF